MYADKYNLETISFNALPDECPLHLLDYGMMTELIQDKVVTLRRFKRKQKKDKIVNKLTLRFLKECLYGLSELGVIDLRGKKHLVSSKKKIVEYVDNHFIPLIYFEESLQKQERGCPVFKVGDRVRCLKLSTLFRPPHGYCATTGKQCGIISYVASNKNYQVDFVKMRVFNDNGNNVLYPDFSQISYSYGSVPIGKYVNGWDLEKIGEETVVSKSLRQRFETCEEERKMKVDYLWTTHLENKIILYQQERITKEQAIRVYLDVHRYNTIEDAISIMGITEDEIVKKGLSIYTSVYCGHIIKSCKNIWFCGRRMNVLDKELWKTIDEPTNLLNSNSRKFGCGYRMEEVELLKHILDRDKLLD